MLPRQQNFSLVISSTCPKTMGVDYSCRATEGPIQDKNKDIDFG